MTEMFRVVMVLCGGGCFGGLLYWVSLYLLSKRDAADHTDGFEASGRFCGAHVLMGVGGAWAVLLAMLWANKAPLGSGLVEELELFGTSIVSGFAGNRVLPLVADQLTETFLKKAEKRTARNARRAERSELTSEVYAYLSPGGSRTKHQTLSFERRLRSELKKDPENRKAAILLARILDELKGDTGGAIKVLEAFVKSKLAAKETPDENVADAYWNIANYYEKLFSNSNGTNRRLRVEALDAIAESVRIVPEYLSNLRTDEDFTDLIADPETAKRLPTLQRAAALDTETES